MERGREGASGDGDGRDIGEGGEEQGIFERRWLGGDRIGRG